MCHNVGSLAAMRTVYVSCVLTIVLCLAADEGEITIAGEESSGISSHKSRNPPKNGEWSEDLIQETLLLSNLMSELRSMPKEELDELLPCFTDRKSAMNCSKTDSRRKKFLFDSLLSAVVNWAKSKFFEQIKGYVNQRQGNYTCYENISCFYPTYRMALEIGGPQTPEQIGTKIKFFPNSTSEGVEVNHTNWAAYYTSSGVNVSKPLFCVTHGFTWGDNITWMYELKEALFSKVDCNVMFVEWINGSMFPYYAAAAANTPLPGVLLSMLLNQIMTTSNCSLLPENVHIIGFSLGAHVAGFCGRHYQDTYGFKLGRITGLDPAGPLFENSNVSLSSTDADFVDIIHTNAGHLQDYRYGLNESNGHVDFYPNGGSNQVKCETADLTDVSCSHDMAYALFIESVKSSTCLFTSHFCQKGWQGYEECKKETNASYIGEMGYNSIRKQGRGDQYLKTNAESPYCIPEDSLSRTIGGEKQRDLF